MYTDPIKPLEPHSKTERPRQETSLRLHHLPANHRVIVEHVAYPLDVNSVGYEKEQHPA